MHFIDIEHSNVKGIDRIMRLLKKKSSITLKRYRKRTFYEKPSILHRTTVQKAIYSRKYKENLEEV